MGKTGEQEKIAAGLVTLARYQGHWVERFTLPLLAVVFTVALLTLLRHSLLSFLFSLNVPFWVLAVGGAASIENVYVAPLMVKARAPFTLRFLDFSTWMVATYALLRLAAGVGEGLSLSWSAIKSPEVYPSLALVGFAWYLGGSFGKQFLYLGSLTDLVGDTGAGALSWEQEAIMSEYTVDRGRIHAMTEFSRRVLYYPFLFSLLAAVAFELNKASLARSQGWSWTPLLAMAVLLLSGLALQGYVYLYRLQTIWREARVQPVNGLVSAWSKNLTCIVLLTVLLAVLLPAGISPISFEKLMDWFARVGSGLSAFQPLSTSPESGAPSVSSAPFAGGLDSTEPSLLEALIPLLFMLLQVLFFVAALLAFLGFCLVTLISNELERFSGLMRIPVLVYLWAREVVRQISSSLRLLGHRGGRVVRFLVERSQQRFSSIPAGVGEDVHEEPGQEPSAVALYVRYLFRRLVRLAAKQGYGPQAAQTPSEYSHYLAAKLDRNSYTVLQELTKWYTEARYSSHPLPDRLRAEVKMLFEAIQSAISQVGRRVAEDADIPRQQKEEEG